MVENRIDVRSLYEYCENGNISMIIEYLDEIKDIKKINKEVLEIMFMQSCEFGHIEIAKLLLKIRPELNISCEDNYAFNYACINNHLDIAQWLYSINPNIPMIDIEMKNNEIISPINLALENKSIDIIDWIKEVKNLNIHCEFYPKFNYVLFDCGEFLPIEIFEKETDKTICPNCKEKLIEESYIESDNCILM